MFIIGKIPYYLDLRWQPNPRPMNGEKFKGVENKLFKVGIIPFLPFFSYSMKIIYLLLLVICFNNCRKVELSVDLPYKGDRLVVYSLLDPTEIITVKVTKTYPPTGKTTYIDGIADADILLFENDKLVERLKSTKNGIYKSETNFKPKEKLAYSLKISAKGFPSVYFNRDCTLIT